MTPNMTATSALPKFACAAQHGINRELVWTLVTLLSASLLHQARPLSFNPAPHPGSEGPWRTGASRSVASWASQNPDPTSVPAQ